MATKEQPIPETAAGGDIDLFAGKVSELDRILKRIHIVENDMETIENRVSEVQEFHQAQKEQRKNRRQSMPMASRLTWWRRILQKWGARK